MPRKKGDLNQPVPDVPPLPPRGREVIYTIMVPGCTDRVKIEAARRLLKELGIREGLIVIGDDYVSVPRFYTLWQGDEAEADWQKDIQSALPHALIDVQDWQPAPGYPQGDMGQTTTQGDSA